MEVPISLTAHTNVIQSVKIQSLSRILLFLRQDKISQGIETEKNGLVGHQCLSNNLPLLWIAFEPCKIGNVVPDHDPELASGILLSLFWSFPLENSLCHSVEQTQFEGVKPHSKIVLNYFKKASHIDLSNESV